MVARPPPIVHELTNPATGEPLARPDVCFPSKRGRARRARGVLKMLETPVGSAPDISSSARRSSTTSTRSSASSRISHCKTIDRRGARFARGIENVETPAQPNSLSAIRSGQRRVIDFEVMRQPWASTRRSLPSTFRRWAAVVLSVRHRAGNTFRAEAERDVPLSQWHRPCPATGFEWRHERGCTAARMPSMRCCAIRTLSASASGLPPIARYIYKRGSTDRVRRWRAKNQ